MKNLKLRLVSLLIAVLFASAALAACSPTAATPPAASSVAPASSAPEASSASVAPSDSSVPASSAPEAASTANRTTINLGYYQGNCELHFYAAEKLGLFDKYGLDINWIVVNDSNAATSLAAGKIDATDGILQGWVKPVEQGLDVRFTLGTQQGCMSTVTLADAPYKTLADLKGKTIGVLGVIGGGPYNYLARTILHETDLDPQKDFQYIAYADPASLNNALDSGKVDAITGADALNFAGVSSGAYKWLTLMATDDYLKEETCCLLALNPKFLEEHKDAATAFTKAVYEASQYVQDPEHKNEILQYAFDKQYIINGTLEANEAIAKEYEWDPGYDIAVSSFSNSFTDYQKAGLIDQNIDVQKIIDKAFVDLGVG